MSDFTVGDATFTRSIALDASTVDSVTVTVAVSATRTEEWEVLDSIYDAAECIDFRPFLHKANDLQYDAHVEFFESLCHDAPVELLATTHFGRDGSDPERVEAVQSALLVSEVATSGTLVLVDGGEAKASTFTRAISGVVPEPPPTTHCVRSEQYFPTALLADICASHLAHQITNPRDCTTVTPSSPETKSRYDGAWGRAYSSLFETNVNYERAPLPSRRGRSVRERVRCWYDGTVAAGDDEYPMTDSLTPVVNVAKERGFQRLADEFVEM